MEMDLLSSYDDETSNSEQTPNRSVPTAGSLLSEWDKFDKSIDCTSHPISSQEVSESKLGDSDNKVGEAKVDKKLLDKVVSPPDEDESHLPPGVRKKNRCHSSSGSSSEDDLANDKGKVHSDSDMSCSDEQTVSTNNSRVSENKSEAKDMEIITSREEKQKGHSKKVKDSRSSSRSRSRSPHKRRRKSHDKHSRRSRSRSRSRHHRTDRKQGSRRSRSKESRRSKDKDQRPKHREKKRSHSRERRGADRDQGKSRDRNRRSWSREQPNRSSRGSKVNKYGDKANMVGTNFGRAPHAKQITFKEKMRQQLIKAIEEGGDVSQAFTAKDGTAAICTQSAGTQQNQPAKKPVPLMSHLVNYPPGLAPAVITAAEAAMQSMLALQKETTERTGVEIPKYYNPAAINPVKYAEQAQKRKLLWSKNKEKDINSQWHATTLSSDHDDKSKEKFRKLMGMKSESGAGGEDGDTANEEQELKQREVFDKLDKEYQYARMATHTHRGMGLGGFGSSSSYHVPDA